MPSYLKADATVRLTPCDHLDYRKTLSLCLTVLGGKGTHG